jgi:hypothetical protein
MSLRDKRLPKNGGTPQTNWLTKRDIWSKNRIKFRQLQTITRRDGSWTLKAEKPIEEDSIVSQLTIQFHTFWKAAVRFPPEWR